MGRGASCDVLERSNHTGEKMSLLEEIAKAEGCTKMLTCGYVGVYRHHLTGASEEVLYEIGIEHGNSLRMWSQYLLDTIIYGFDIDPECEQVEVGRAITTIVDVANPPSGPEASAHNDFADVVSTLPPPTIVIDDGSHKPRDQAAAFDILWPLLEPGGLYFIEDLHIWNEGSFVYQIAGMAVDVMRTNRQKVKGGDPAILRYPKLSVAAVHAYPGICVLEKA